MKDLFVPYEIAIGLKKLGFNEPCVGIYHSRLDFTITSKMQEKISFTFGMFQYPKRNSDANTVSGTFIGEEGCYAPMYQQVFDWFREQHNLTWEQQFADSHLYLYIGEIAYPEPCLEHFKVFEVPNGKYNETVNIAKNEVIKGLIELIKNK